MLGIRNCFKLVLTSGDIFVKSNTDLYKIPRFGIPKDISSFLAVLGKAKIKGAK
jgi:hypothetical protein